MFRIRTTTLALSSVLALSAGAAAQSQARDTVPIYTLGQLVVLGRAYDLTSIASTASQGFVGARDLRRRPLLREGELLETVPGLIMTQHSGDGKSNQMFVRGFNLDHGTDFHTRLEGMPMNMVTHAHGQGYTDLNFIIPEFVDHIEYRLGTYYAGIGDFGAAGGAEFRLRKSLERPFMVGGLGENGFSRVTAGASTPLLGGSLLAGGEVKNYDGPWNLPQELQKLSGLLRWSRTSGAHSFSLLAMGYDNQWNASDQIPLRLLNNGSIDRYAQIDSTLGGASQRFSFSGEWLRSAGQGGQRLQAYAVRSDLDLFSNFTYFLDNPTAGDQIRQRDRGRWTLGANATHVQPLGSGDHQLTFGLQTRYDMADVALYRARARSTTETVRRDDVNEWGSGAWVEAESRWTPALRSVLGLRADAYFFDVQGNDARNSGNTRDGIVSPKASLIFQPSSRAEFYASAGLGFHSNDARGTVQSIDPVSGAAVDPVNPLVRSRGAELGMRASLLPGLRTTLALWGVELDSELLFVGDAGTTEPSDGSRRVGVTFANFWRVTPQLTADLDLSFTRARFVDAGAADHIPGALENVIAAGLAWEPLENGLLASARLRHLGPHALIEDNSVRGDPVSILNLAAGYRRGPAQVTLSLLNALDSKGADIQYFYSSRLRSEPAGGVDDIHIHPIEPRQLRLSVSLGF